MLVHFVRAWPIAALLFAWLTSAPISPAHSLEQIHVIRSITDADGEVVGFCYDPPDWVWVDEPDAVEAIEKGLVSYYTEVNGIRAEVYVREIDGEKHIWTRRDNSTENNLSNLDECPDRPEIV